MTVGETIAASLRLLNRRDRRLLGVAVLIQMVTSLLDLAGIALIGLAGALSVTTLAGQPAPQLVRALASAAGLGQLSDRALVAILAGLAAAVLLAKSVVSPLLMARVFAFLARREAVVSARLTSELLSRPLTFVQRRSTQESSAALVRGANAATVIVLGQMVAGTSELALLATLAISLLLINPPVALGAIAFFSAITWGLQRALGARATRFGSERARFDTTSQRTVQEVLGAYREIVVTDRRAFYVERLDALRNRAARAGAGSQLVMMLPKYVFEAALVVGAFGLAAVLFTTRPVAVAAGTFALFLAAATRVMPSLLRLQTAALSIRGATGSASYTYALSEDLGDPMAAPGIAADRDAAAPKSLHGHAAFMPTVDLQGVTFAYPGAGSPAIRDITMTIGAGQSVALVGRSGAGKSTLADVILGVLRPEAGVATIGGIPSGDALHRWPGAIAYVPQEIMLVEDSVRANVALGLPAELVEDDVVWEALDLAHLADFVRSKTEGLDAPVGERGLRLSGGQRQRLGIARALFTRPRLLVLDEATSALDAETEQGITEILAELNGVTMVIIAHRLSTVRHADLVVYLENGHAAASGTFDDVCSRVPSLARQAELMGLSQPQADR